MAQVAVADCLARAVVVALEASSEAHRPLTQSQKIDLVRTMLLEFDGFSAHVTGVLETERILNEVLPRGPRPPNADFRRGAS